MKIQLGSVGWYLKFLVKFVYTVLGVVGICKSVIDIYWIVLISLSKNPQGYCFNTHPHNREWNIFLSFPVSPPKGWCWRAATGFATSTARSARRSWAGCTSSQWRNNRDTKKAGLSFVNGFSVKKYFLVCL